ncbi:3-dehydroquinate synthase [Buchnera aphidicola]|uniref:3-dehydroquinate synthase n=1 Tax=Buchnera aphidicola TaxID=9 RepID=UPI0031B6A1B7
MCKKNIQINLSHSSYSIYMGVPKFTKKKIKNLFFFGSQNIIVTNFTVRKILLNNFLSMFLNLKIKYKIIVLKDGELYKNLKTVDKILSFLLENQCDRNTNLIAFGGGVIGDITGFVASIYQRGISFIQIPTTLLAQVDASIGGKTGVNHILGKNMIGSFWQPKLVLININFLKFLSKKELLSGISEVIKYAIIFDKNFFIWLENNIFKVLNLEKKELSYCILQCCKFKKKIIEMDEKECSSRALLNLGHSFAHAIETYTGYSTWLHGYAVSAGIVLASYLSYYLKYLSLKNFSRIIDLFQKIKLPILGPLEMCGEEYIRLMFRDKKTVNGKIFLILPYDIGNVKIYELSDTNIILKIFKNIKKEKFFSNLNK